MVGVFIASGVASKLRGPMQEIPPLDLLERCGRGDCSAAIAFLEARCPDKSLCARPLRGSKKAGGDVRYQWINTIIRRGVPDGRSRLILYVISRYLVNIQGLSDEEAQAEIDSFIEASCKNFGNCGKIYKSWIRNVLKHVRRGGWKPWSLERMKRDDPELYNIVARIVEGAGVEEEK
jgi:hypothetical protein